MRYYYNLARGFITPQACALLSMPSPQVLVSVLFTFSSININETIEYVYVYNPVQIPSLAEVHLKVCVLNISHLRKIDGISGKKCLSKMSISILQKRKVILE